MARTVADLQAMFKVMQGPDDGDPCFAPVPLRTARLEHAGTIGYFEEDGRTPVMPETRNAVRSAVWPSNMRV